MTNRQRLAKLRQAEEALKRTTRGYEPNGVHWRRAMALIDEVQADLEPDPLPSLGTIIRGGKSLLAVSLTHNTDGIALYPAFDDGWIAGKEVLAPEALTVVRPSTSSSPGAAFYALGASRLRYWFGHLDRTPKIGTRYVRGQVVGRIVSQSRPHVHCGVNAEAYLGPGRQLLYGAKGNGPDYTTGAPTIGAQLAKALA